MEHLWKERTGRVSYQVLQEFYVNVTVKLKPGLSAEAARRDVLALFEWQPVAADRALIQGAWLAQDRYGLSWWDSLIISAAQSLECEYLLSGDFQSGQVIGGVRVISPFESDPRAFVAGTAK
jgi:predicted nucleic acid-binding protein